MCITTALGSGPVFALVPRFIASAIVVALQGFFLGPLNPGVVLTPKGEGDGVFHSNERVWRSASAFLSRCVGSVGQRASAATHGHGHVCPRLTIGEIEYDAIMVSLVGKQTTGEKR